jgi:hypothetical protein
MSSSEAALPERGRRGLPLTPGFWYTDYWISGRRLRYVLRYFAGRGRGRWRGEKSVRLRRRQYEALQVDGACPACVTGRADVMRAIGSDRRCLRCAVRAAREGRL